MRCYFSVIGQSFNTVAAYPVILTGHVDPVENRFGERSSIERMYPFTRNVKRKFTPSHPKEIVMEMVVTYEGKITFAEAEIEIHAVVTSVKQPSAINKDRAGWQRCPANTSVRFRLRQKTQDGPQV